MPNSDDVDPTASDRSDTPSEQQIQTGGDEVPVVSDVPALDRLRRVLLIIGSAVVAIMLIAISISGFVKVKYYAQAPGSTTPVDTLLNLPTANKFSHNGQMYFTTVSESSGRISALEYFIDKHFHHDTDLVPAKEFEQPASQPSCFTPNQEDAKLFTDSQKIALSLALRRLDKPVTTSFSYFQIEGIEKDSAAQGKILACERLVSVDNQEIVSVDQPGNIIRAKKPGDTVHVVLANEKTQEQRALDIQLGEKDGHAFLGIDLVGPINLTVTTSENVSFPKSDIGGPSAGLALTLGLIDDLSPGDLTGGKKIAATGQMDLGGDVMEIGGIKQKTISVYRQGIRVFLVPQENYKDAKAAAPKGMEIVSVHTLDDALTALHDHGGDTSSLPAPVDLTKV